ncbi:hypothetical protein FQA47_003625 [Oryzias melastigma]|uniref:Uncharacterized protein n=1 Tax=Oryzias melastigma TaxID=30732 RepID=A0A834CEX9_ORYME|nr:hypothetical protein FQA47_003625 [Oryzias melastigma]
MSGLLFPPENHRQQLRGKYQTLERHLVVSQFNCICILEGVYSSRGTPTPPRPQSLQRLPGEIHEEMAGPWQVSNRAGTKLAWRMNESDSSNLMEKDRETLGGIFCLAGSCCLSEEAQSLRKHRVNTSWEVTPPLCTVLTPTVMEDKSMLLILME